MGYPWGGTSAESDDGSERNDEVTAAPRAVPALHHRGVYERAIKPVFDVAVGIVMSIITLPIVLVLLPGIWKNLGTPAIYRQTRVGRFGKEFTVYKLRTMKQDRRQRDTDINHEDRRQNHKSPDDPRHVPYGRFLRKWSLDEIPQFWNVALGQMALVGPRPELPSIVARYQDWQHRRHEVKPGLTGLWQVTERGNVPMHEATHIDIEYVDNVTFLGDVRILMRTPGAVLGSRVGA